MNSLSALGFQATSPFNLEELHNRCMGRMDLLERVLGRFQDTLDSDVAELEEALRNADAPQVAKLAHRIKGTSVTVSAQRLSECALNLEKLAKTAEFDAMAICASELKRECSLLKEFEWQETE